MPDFLITRFQPKYPDDPSDPVDPSYPADRAGLDLAGIVSGGGQVIQADDAAAALTTWYQSLKRRQKQALEDGAQWCAVELGEVAGFAVKERPPNMKLEQTYP